MVNYFVYARDCSFSTFNNEHYHFNGLKTLEQFKRDVEEIKQEHLIIGESPAESRIIYLHWGDDCWEVDEDTTRATYLKMDCEQMGTEPEWIIRYLRKKCVADENDQIKLLYIITDGKINNYSADRCFRLNEYMYYDKFVFHAFNEDLNQINLSVATSFFKSQCVVYRNGELCVRTDISKDFEYEKINVYTFSAKKNQLKAYITLKYIDNFTQDAVALQEIDKLKELKDRLFDELFLKLVNTDKTGINIGINDRDVFLREFIETDWHNNHVPALYLIKADIEKSILALINYILKDTKSYSFDTLKFDPILNEFVGDEQIGDVDITAEKEFEIFDFILEDDIGISYENMGLVDVT